MTVIEWTGENGVSYNVTTLPDVPLASIGDTSVRVIIPYDTQFMVNVSAMLCEEEVTTIENFFYGKSDVKNIILYPICIPASTCVLLALCVHSLNVNDCLPCIPVRHNGS